MATYLSEFRWQWTTVLGGSLGLALGAALHIYTLSLFGPPLIAEFGWTRAQFALVSSLSLFTLVLVPFLGRFVDRVGPRVAGTIGYVAVPACFLAFSLMSGNILELYAITIVKNVLGVLTTSLVFCRVIVERFEVARGLALSCAMTGPPLVGALAAPIVGEIIDTDGWRAAYRAMALVSFLGGMLAMVLIGLRKPRAAAGEALPAEAQPDGAEPPRAKAPPLTRAEFLALARHPVFALLIGGMFLINIPQVIVASQMKLVLFESGASNDFATWLISIFAMSVIVGRFICGYALDRLPPHLVAAAALSLPALGLFALASPFDASWVLLGAIAVTGMAQGAEGDVGAMLTSRKFALQHYSFIYSFVVAAIGAATAVGSLVLSLMLHLSGTYNGFLVLAGAATLLGVACFFLIGRYGKAEPSAPAAPAPQAA